MHNIKSMLATLGVVDSMQIFMKTTEGRTITLDVKSTDTIDKVKSLILDSRTTVSYGGKQLKNGLVMDYNIQQKSTLHESGRLDGGVKKSFLKREDAPKALKTELRNLMKSQAMEVNERPDIDENIITTLRSFQEKIDAMKVLRASGVRIIASGLRQLRDEDIGMLSEIMSERKGRNSMLMEKIPRAIDHAYPLMRKMRDSMAALTNKQEEVRGVLLDIMAEEYILYESGSVSLDTTSLKEDIKNELTRRGTLKSIGHVEEPIDNGIGCMLL